MNEPHPVVSWTEADETRSANWHSEAGTPPPKRVVIADDTLSADSAYRLACEGTAILWRGDFQNARQLLLAIARRIDRKPQPKATKAAKAAKTVENISTADAFNKHRLAQSQRARTLGMLLLPFEADFSVPLRRAPDVRQACLEAYGQVTSPFVASMRELLGLIGAHEWHRKGVEIAALSERIHPHYGVFAPTRSEYIDLVANAPLPSKELAFDIGTGTGVLAAVLARRGVAQIIATDNEPRALVCANENFKRLRVNKQASAVQADLFPPGRAPLIVCNPPWVPARPSSPLEHAIYDPESRMLHGFLSGLAEHLSPRGEGWLILSDLAEHLGLRSREALLGWIETAGLKVLGRIDAKPTHPKAADDADALHLARAAEVTSLWRLGIASL
ncbi:MAG: Protein-N(5)-glutamine methyltransferase PrmC, methylates polypeptide chain release factor [Rhodocyclales bacterium]|nr:Protein-N(5)-glutamine methyltransferase PrmC, methylates polypeptide chain release factor [Rhodocyclales bacterium]